MDGIRTARLAETARRKPVLISRWPSGGHAGQDVPMRTKEEKMRYTCPALFRRDKDEPGWWAEFPDVPGCLAQGDDAEDVREMAAEALGLHVEGMLRRPLRLRPPSDPSALRAEDGFVALVTMRDINEETPAEGADWRTGATM